MPTSKTPYKPQNVFQTIPRIHSGSRVQKLLKSQTLELEETRVRPNNPKPSRTTDLQSHPGTNINPS